MTKTQKALATIFLVTGILYFMLKTPKEDK